MAKTSDWLPTGRQNQLNMAQNWTTIMREPADSDTLNPMPPADAHRRSISQYWNIPDSIVDELQTLTQAAASALTIAQNEETRTKVTNAACKTAFDTLIEIMRNCKKRYFYVPPLTEVDLVRLGLKIPDTTPTASGTPTAEVTIETYLVGRHQLGIRFIYLTGSASDPANKGYRVWYSVIGQGVASTDAPPPTNPKELKESFYTKRKKDVIDFEFGDSGKTAYFAVQLENEGRKGPWGLLVSALIP